MPEPSRKGTVPMWVWSGTVPCLNGFRALAILCVVGSHLNESRGSWSVGHFGVTSFFVISGFLITLLLLRERRNRSKISLTAFYRRRALRIIPAYVFLLLVTGAIAALGAIPISRLTWITVLTYTSCFATLSISSLLAHTWSLSVEEHFYVIWPALYAWAGTKPSAIILCLYVVSAPLIRYSLLWSGNRALDINYSSIVQMSSIATGCLIAFFVTGSGPLRSRTFAARHPAWLAVFGFSLLLASMGAFGAPSVLREVLSDPVRALSFGCIMLGVLYSDGTNLVRRVLQSRVMKLLGILSYSVYLWQQLFTRQERLIPGGFTTALCLIFLAALMSYHFIEKPFLRWKERLSARMTPQLAGLAP